MSEKSSNQSLKDRIAKRKQTEDPLSGDGKPLTDKQIAINALVVIVISFVAYFITLAREPMFGDGLELLAAAATGGVPHPTGYPLLMLLLGPFSGSYFSGALFCAVLAALTAGCLTILTGRLLTPSLKHYSEQIQTAVIISIGLIAGFSSSLWLQAVIVEVYALNALIVSACLVILFSKGDGDAICWRQLSIVALLASLGAGNHLTIGCLIFLFLAKLIQSFTTKHARVQHLPLIIACGIIPFILLYYFLMVRAASSPAINWGDPSNFETLLWVLRGGDYGQTQFLMVDARSNTPFTISTYVPFFFARAADLIIHLGTQILVPLQLMESTVSKIFGFLFGLLVLVLIFMGLVQLYKSSKMMTVGYILTLAAYEFFLFTYNIPDISDYYLAFFILLFPAILLGLNQVILFVSTRMYYVEPDRQIRLAVFFGLLVLVGFLSNFAEASQGRRLSAASIILRFEKEIPENAIVITHGDTDTYALWYLKFVEQKRQNILVVASNFMRNEWYQTMLPEEGGDPLGRYVEVAPGSFKDFTAEDQYAMIRNNIIEPNYDLAPITITNLDQLMLRFANTEYELQSVVQLVDTEEEVMQYVIENYAPPPTALIRINKSDDAEETQENSVSETP